MTRPVRILQVLGGMELGGAETWLMHVLRKIDREQFRIDFLVHAAEKCAYDDEVLALGSRLLRCPSPSLSLSYPRAFLRIVRSEGPYDVLHSHVHYFSGFILSLARRAGIPARIAHSHTDARAHPREASCFRQCYRNVMRALIWRNATQGLAASRLAAEDLFGSDWERDGRFRVLHCGLDLAQYAERVDGPAIRKELGLPADALVVGHVGRFVSEKNHVQLVDVVAEMVRLDPRVHALFVGDGPLRSEIERRVASEGIGGRIVFAGPRRDVARLLRGAMDVFVFPSLAEGLGLAVVEAQAAGVPCLVATSVPSEVAQSPLVSWLPLKESPAVWARRALVLARTMRRPLPSTVGWTYELRTSLRALEEQYLRPTIEANRRWISSSL